MRRKILITLLVLTTVALSVYSASKADNYYRETRKNVSLFSEIYLNIIENYVDVVNPEPFIQAAVDGMLDELDPYTAFFDQQGTERLRDRSRGEYGGIGMRVGLQGAERRLTVIAPFDGTPAARAGLRPGDIILAVDSIDITEMPLDEAVTYMRGLPGTPVSLRIERPGLSGTMEFAFKREIILLHDVQLSTLLEKNIGYIKLNGFSEKAAIDLETALVDLRLQDMAALVLDLRSNPGGLLSAAVDVSDLFLPLEAPIVSTRGRNGELLEQFSSTRAPLLPPGMPLVVLVDQGTASAAEIVAGTLQDHDRAVIIGVNSFGKGLVQGVINLPSEKTLKITKARYYLPSGRLIQRVEYFRDNETLDHELSAMNISGDTLYSTSHGREVLSGRGIIPDIEVEAVTLSRFTGEIWRQRKVFDYLTELEIRQQLPVAVEVSESLLDGLSIFLADSEFKLPAAGAAELDSLEAIINREEYPETVLVTLQQLRLGMESNLAAEFAQYREEVSRLLLLELADRLEGSSGRVRASLRQDPVLERAMDLLQHRTEWLSMLNLVVE
ncbi:MAG: S41 family peptidase [Candidatus Delongbacteria bacterium]|nr:S41 family peptidase [Candidatus Delongbacteria bacterium]